jgi:chemotaxis signal transduction protein
LLLSCIKVGFMSRYGLFCSAEIAYAIPLGRLQRVLSGQHCYLLPKLPRAVAGVFIWDGLIIPLLALAQLFHDSPQIVTQGAYQVLIASEYGILALPAEQTCGIVAEQQGVLVAATEKTTPGIAGEFQFQGRVFQILDIDSLAIDLTH